MGITLAHETREYIDWLNGGTDEGARLAAELLALPAAEWERWAAAHPDVYSYHAFDELYDAAYGLLTSDAPRAVALTEFLVLHVDDVAVPYENARTALRGRAWIERSNALRQILDLPRALEASTRAIEIFSADATAYVEIAAARRNDAMIRFMLGERGEPLAVVAESARVFEEAGDLGQLLRARMYEGVMLFTEREFERAAASFTSALDIASSLADERSMAGIHLNLGNCYQEVRRFEEAVAHLVLALKLFEQYGMTTEAPRAVWGLAQVLHDTGRVEQAAMKLRGVASELTTAGLPVEGALVWLDLLDMFVLLERYDEVRTRAAELTRIFAATGMSVEARHALDLLVEASAHATISTAQIDRVRVVVRGSALHAG